jgi:hypothetical protein
MSASDATPRRALGRPPGTGKGRTSRLGLTMTAEGKAAALQLAELAGLSVSEWIEQCVLREQRRIAKHG